MPVAAETRLGPWVRRLRGSYHSEFNERDGAFAPNWHEELKRLVPTGN